MTFNEPRRLDTATVNRMAETIMQAILDASPLLPDPKKEKISDGVTKIELEHMVPIDVATEALLHVIAGIAVQSGLVQTRALTKAFGRAMVEAIEGHIKTIRDGQKGTPFAEQFRVVQRH